MPGPKYGEFSFPETVHVKGHARGGPVRTPLQKPKPDYVARAMRPGVSALAKGGVPAFSHKPKVGC